MNACDAMQQQSPGAHPHTLVKQQVVHGAGWCIRLATIHCCSHKVCIEHQLSHDANLSIVFNIIDLLFSLSRYIINAHPACQVCPEECL